MKRLRVLISCILGLLLMGMPVLAQSADGVEQAPAVDVGGLFDDAGVLVAFILGSLAGGGGVLIGISKLANNTDALSAMERMAERLERSYPSQVYDLLVQGGRIAQEAGYVIEEVFDNQPLQPHPLTPSPKGEGETFPDLGSHPGMAQNI